MKIRKDFVLRQLADKWVILPLSEKNDLTGMLRLNDSGVFLWRMLEEGADNETLAAALVNEYGIPSEQAYTDVEHFLQKLKLIGCLAD